MIESDIKAYLAAIGRKGGLKSRRRLSPGEARRMVAVRLARQAFREYRTLCFWSYRNIDVHGGNVEWVADRLRRNGNRAAWKAAARIKALLCP